MMIKNKNMIWGLIFCFMIFNTLNLLNIKFIFLPEIFSTLYIAVVPGFLFLSIIDIKKLPFIESFLYIIGLSLSFLLLVGISTNLLGFFFHIYHPLTFINSLYFFDFFVLILFMTVLLLKKRLYMIVNLPSFNIYNMTAYTTALLLPLLSIVGTQVLNNGITNFFIMLMLFLTAMYVFVINIVKDKLNGFYYEIPIFLIAISLLFMFSLRSPYIIGWDIYQEYKVFLLTEVKQIWSMNNFNDPYNACLSITILPVLFHYFTHISNELIFKVMYQLFFAFVPVILYSLFRMFTKGYYSFLSVFFFMSTSGFFLYMPSLLRQEIAYLFFALLLYSTFSKNINSMQKNVFFFIFSTSIILSHYSTTYVLIGLFIFSSSILTFYNHIISKLIHKKSQIFVIKPLLVIVFITISYIWFVLITGISSNITLTLKKTANNFTKSDLMTPGTSIADQINFSPKPVDSQLLLNRSITESSKNYFQKNLKYYPISTYSDYSPIIINQNPMSLTIPAKISRIIYFIGNSITKAIKLLTILGLVYLVFLFKNKTVNAEYLVLFVGFVIAIGMITTIPVLSLQYPINRLTQQALFLGAFPTILSLSWLLKTLKNDLRIYCTTLLIVIYFLFNTSFIPQLVGGSEPQIFLNNYGIFYDEIYLHKTELVSINWLESIHLKDVPIFTDVSSAEKMKGYSQISWTFIGIFPSIIYKNSYVYSNFSNTLSGIGIVNIKDTRMKYNIPENFLYQNKNLIYSNGQTKIYK